MACRTTRPLTPADDALLRTSIPCRFACPAQTNVPAYLEAIARDDFDEAYRINLRDNVFPATLGYACTRPCETACRHGQPGNGESVAICFSKRSAADFRSSPDPVVLEPLFPSTGKKVAIIGSGVAGLAAARELARLGHAVTVFERHHRPGGLLMLGIPHFRLPRDVVEKEIEQIRLQGVDIRCGVQIGQDIKLADLIEENDHVIIATGAQQPNIIQVPGSDLEGVEHGLRFLFRVNEQGSAVIGRRVVVLGGGFTSMDCARAAKRLDADSVAIYYRRTEADMYVSNNELEELQRESIALHTLCSPVEIVGENGRVAGIRFRRTQAGPRDASGRQSFKEIPGSDFDVACDTILLGTGQSHETAWAGKVLSSLLKHGGPGSGLNETSLPCVTQAGDFATGPRSIIDGIAHGKKCAYHVDALLMGRVRIGENLVSEPVETTGRDRALNAVPRHAMPCAEVPARTIGTPDELGYARESARAEAARCYLCHYVYEIDASACIYCHKCLEVKPLDTCIVKISGLLTDAEGRVTGYHEVEGGPEYNQLYIDPGACIRCHACVEVCPVDCIHLRRIDVVQATI
ncbi:MAG TPA: FAD-dependent oxidoreductase [Kiritimatiellia bacterium]|nr:FAD-dependent oxidoreductase [Kiritimatiellia bacterium]HMP00519.1 FAD-dependent oxidoreductase [Kiritimatiellia bacterium]